MREVLPAGSGGDGKRCVASPTYQIHLAVCAIHESDGVRTLLGLREVDPWALPGLGADAEPAPASRGGIRRE